MMDEEDESNLEYRLAITEHVEQLEKKRYLAGIIKVTRAEPSPLPLDARLSKS